MDLDVRGGWDDEERARLLREYQEALQAHQDAVDRVEIANVSLYHLKKGSDHVENHRAGHTDSTDLLAREQVAWWVIAGNGLVKLTALVVAAYQLLFIGIVYLAALGLFLVGTLVVFALVAMVWSAGTHG